MGGPLEGGTFFIGGRPPWPTVEPPLDCIADEKSLSGMQFNQIAFCLMSCREWVRVHACSIPYLPHPALHTGLLRTQTPTEY